MAVQLQISNFMDKTKQWGMYNHGYKKSHGTTTTLLNMCDLIMESCDENKIITAIATDQSAAFECVSHQTLLRKLELYNFGDRTLKWIKSYLNFITQFVSIGDKESVMLPLLHGVPQGSVLGPIMYTLYINEMGTIPNSQENCKDTSHQRQEKLFNTECKKCGIIFGYADDTTYLSTTNSRNTNQDNITRNLENINKFLEANQLSINTDKTTLIEIMLHQKKAKIKGDPPTLNTTDDKGNPKIVVAVREAVLLGGTIQENTFWQAHLTTGEQALLPKVRQKLGLLKYICKTMSIAGKKTLANGLLLSRLCYLISIWGGTQNKYLKLAQVVLNNIARWVLNRGKRAKTMNLMKEINWLTIKEMTTYYSLIAMWKTIWLKAPEYLQKKITIKEDYLIEKQHPRLKNTLQSFRFRTIPEWNSLPLTTRQLQSLPRFKHQVKSWIKEQREPDPGWGLLGQG